MMIKKIWAASFSPTGGTEHIVSLLAEEMGKCLKLPVHKISFTLPDERKKSCTFTEEDLLILGTPVYAGRIPNKILPDVDRSFEGNGTLAVAVSVFGNRNYDDGLMELALLLENHGFCVAAAAAAAARHAFSDDIGAGRPDKQDEEELRVFARRAAEKIKEFSGVEKIVSGNKAACGVLALQITGHNPVGPYYTPLRADGQPAKFLKAKPVTDENLCNRCGTCAQVCPMGSISREDPSVVNGICIKCQACIRACPTQAKHFEDEDFLSHVEMLREHYTRRAANAFFL
ncbi:MAG TPA: 4Fe-4S binding protein [Candidatus Anaerobutyricum stercoris]|uniref:4Fe-4S binding protein n=1 Tax=Candidatus Anaerobutyricum stercoris TaxID=2838457 RepID=A0A9D2ELS0_9FIRM|nr:4Fe-4S binding protein [Eubacterium sp. An3]OUO27462.1 hypothetical protein B5F87_10435 [Eubacterium sp. An3]HIZ39867.1 4Fe-4S binding protein [Candidatus Anaerobutyricum stercoris]